MNQQKFTREQLCELVWSEPMTVLASKHNITTDALRKICEGNNIPTPKAGHWMKLQFGKTSEREPLPELEGEMPEFSLHPERGLGEGKIISASAVRPLQQQIEKECGSLLQVPNRLTKPDPLVAHTKEIFDKLEYIPEWNNGLQICAHKGVLDISVSPPIIPRALRFMDTIIKVLRLRGHDIKIEKGKTIVTICEEEIEISLREKLRRELSNGKYSWQTSTYLPTGLLALKMSAFLTDTEWKDEKIPMEQMLSKIVAKLELKAEDAHEKRLVRDRYWEKVRAEERKEKEIEALKEKELSDFKNLLKEANRWREAQMLRDYINFVQKEEAISGKDQKRKDWVEWSSRKADWYDPQKNETDKWLEGVEKNDLIIHEKED